jgi:hypothetical protein
MDRVPNVLVVLVAITGGVVPVWVVSAVLLGNGTDLEEVQKRRPGLPVIGPGCFLRKVLPPGGGVVGGWAPRPGAQSPPPETPPPGLVKKNSLNWAFLFYKGWHCVFIGLVFFSFLEFWEWK